jgi:hypothetical protein
MSEPETGRVLQLDATGELLGLWDLPAQLGRFVKPVGRRRWPGWPRVGHRRRRGQCDRDRNGGIDRGFGGFARMKQKKSASIRFIRQIRGLSQSHLRSGLCVADAGGYE